MKMDFKKIAKKIDTKDWKTVPVEFGPHTLEVSVPPDCVELSMRDVPVIPDERAGFEKAFSNPSRDPLKRSSGARKRPRIDRSHCRFRHYPACPL
jgi:hypothetical protein